MVIEIQFIIRVYSRGLGALLALLWQIQALMLYRSLVEAISLASGGPGSLVGKRCLVWGNRCFPNTGKKFCV